MLEPVQPLHTVREQAAQPSGVLGLGDGQVSDSGLEVLPVRVHRAEHDLVSEDEVKVDGVGRDLHSAHPAGDAGQDDHAVLPEQHAHGLEREGRETRSLEDQVELPVLLGGLLDRGLRRADVAGAQRLH